MHPTDVRSLLDRVERLGPVRRVRDAHHRRVFVEVDEDAIELGQRGRLCRDPPVIRFAYGSGRGRRVAGANILREGRRRSGA